jgi:hypothetical protein
VTDPLVIRKVYGVPDCTSGRSKAEHGPKNTIPSPSTNDHVLKFDISCVPYPKASSRQHILKRYHRAGVIGNLEIGLSYIKALRGAGCVFPNNYLMEDTANSEVSRSQSYQ